MRLRWHITGIVVIFLYLLFRFSKTISTLLDDTRPYVLTEEELGTPSYDPTPKDDTSLIPRIIHQVYLGWGGMPMPDHWVGAQQSCVDLHPDYEYKLWNNETARELLKSDYPWFLDTWDQYSYPIQQADSIRYFILEKYGGLYVDLDNGCKRRLDPLLMQPAWMPGTTNHIGLTNHVMGAMQNHPYMSLLVRSLQAYDRNLHIPYLTIMNSAGPHFVSMVWDEYLKKSTPSTSTVRVLDQEGYEGHSWSFFTKQDGGTWHKWSPDVAAFRWMGQHVVPVATVAVIALGLAVALAWRVGWLLILLVMFKKEDSNAGERILLNGSKHE